MIVKLVVSQGNTTLKEVTLRRPRTVAGRKKGCKLRICSELVSRIHCTFICDRGRVSVKDLGSSNGTFVNGLRTTEAPLKAGDVVQIGPIKFVVKILDEAALASKQTPAAPDDQLPNDEVVFFDADDEPEQVAEADLLEGDAEEVEFVTEGEGNRVVPADQNIFTVDDPKPLDANQFLIPDDEQDGGDYGLADSNKPKRHS